MYETKAMIPVAIGCPNHRVVYYTTEGNEQGLRINLDFLEESRITATIRNEVYRLRAIQYHNLKIKNREFKCGDLVLRKLKATNNKGGKGKLALKQDGPFKVIRVIKANTYHLQDIEGKNLPHAWHSDHLKIYYNA